MKYATLTLVAFFVASSALFVACASGNESEVAGGVGGHSSTGTGTGTTSGGGTGNSSGNTSTGGTSSSSGASGTTSSGTAGCIANCNIDADCAGTCNGGNPPASGAYCCDTTPGMNQCFQSMSSPCPGGSTSSSSGTSTGT